MLLALIDAPIILGLLFFFVLGIGLIALVTFLITRTAKTGAKG